jgi:hypothetical protein
MADHADQGRRCLVYHDDGEGGCVICTCGEHHRPSEFRSLMQQQADRLPEGIQPAIESASAHAGDSK